MSVSFKLIGRNAQIHLREFLKQLASIIFCFLIIAHLTIAHAQSPRLPNESPDFVRGVVRASAQADISTKITEQVSSVNVKEGERFQRGMTLISFDCRLYEGKLAVARALKREMAVSLKSAEFLASRGSGNLNKSKIAKARLDHAASEADIVQTQLEQCTIKAPFDGRVAQVNVHEHEIADTDEPLMSIIALQDPRIEMIVPSSWLTWISLGSRFQFKIDETGDSYTGLINRISATVDAVSQTIKVFGEFDEATSDVIPGMSGPVKFLPDSRLQTLHILPDLLLRASAAR